MVSEKLHSILSALSKVERNRFRKYLLSPYLNEQPELIPFFDLLDRSLRDESFEKLDRKTVWQKLYPKKTYNDADMRRLSSDLGKVALDFLIAEAKDPDPVQEALALQRLLDKPGLKKHLAGVERKIQRSLENADGESPDYYLAGFQLHNNIVNRSTKYLTVAGFAENLSSADHFLDCFYLTQKLELYIGWLMFKGSRVAEKELALPNGFWEQLSEPRFQNVPLLLVYRQVVNCLDQPNEELHFRNLLESLEQQSARLAKTDLRKCYFIAQNYCALKINQGKAEYYRQVFEIFKKIIQKDILLEEGVLSEGIFKNIITSGLGVKEYDWTERFIEDYSAFLPTPIRQNAYTFNLAYLYFHQKKYANVLELLRNVEYNDVVYALGSKLILIQTYYELDEVMALDSLIESFRIFLRRNKVLSKNLKSEYLNYLFFVKKLNMLHGMDKKAVSKFRDRVMSAKHPTYKRWVLEKIDRKRQ